jgi:hypothetical protein
MILLLLGALDSRQNDCEWQSGQSGSAAWVRAKQTLMRAHQLVTTVAWGVQPFDAHAGLSLGISGFPSAIMQGISHAQAQRSFDVAYLFSVAWHVLMLYKYELPYEDPDENGWVPHKSRGIASIMCTLNAQCAPTLRRHAAGRKQGCGSVHASVQCGSCQ